MKDIIFSKATELEPREKDQNGLPVGVQIIGRRWSEERLLAIAKPIAAVTAGFRCPPGY